MNYRYTLEKYAGPSTRYACPQCGIKRTFTRYIDTETNQHLSAEVGRCNREQKCGYHYKPKQYFADHPEQVTHPQPLSRGEGKKHFPSEEGCRDGASTIHDTKAQEVTRGKPLETTNINKQSFSTMPLSTMQESFTQYDCNHFVHYLRNRLGDERAFHLAKQYHVGTSNYWDCSTVFWQVDAQQRIRTGKVMLYRPDNGRRIKTPRNYITWMHSVLKCQDYHLQQCLFGEHLLTGRCMNIGLVESEKTAILASAHFPEYTWLATGGLSNIGATLLQVLDGHNVTLFPDAGAAHKWAVLQGQLRKCRLSYLLEQHDDLINNGDDLADGLLTA